MAVILAMNKRGSSKEDLFFEGYFTDVCLRWRGGLKRKWDAEVDVGLGRTQKEEMSPEVPPRGTSPPTSRCASFPHPPQADADAISLFALELGDALSARSLECAYASALSVVRCAEDHGQKGGGLLSISRAWAPRSHSRPPLTQRSAFPELIVDGGGLGVD